MVSLTDAARHILTLRTSLTRSRSPTSAALQKKVNEEAVAVGEGALSIVRPLSGRSTDLKNLLSSQ